MPAAAPPPLCEMENFGGGKQDGSSEPTAAPEGKVPERVPNTHPLGNPTPIGTPTPIGSITPLRSPAFIGSPTLTESPPPIGSLTPLRSPRPMGFSAVGWMGAQLPHPWDQLWNGHSVAPAALGTRPGLARCPRARGGDPINATPTSQQSRAPPVAAAPIADANWGIPQEEGAV